MKKSKYSEEQIMTALRQVDAGASIPEVIERLGSARLLIMCGGSGMGRWPSLRSGRLRWSKDFVADTLLDGRRM